MTKCWMIKWQRVIKVWGVWFCFDWGILECAPKSICSAGLLSFWGCLQSKFNTWARVGSWWWSIWELRLQCTTIAQNTWNILRSTWIGRFPYRSWQVSQRDFNDDGQGIVSRRWVGRWDDTWLYRCIWEVCWMALFLYWRGTFNNGLFMVDQVSTGLKGLL